MITIIKENWWMDDKKPMMECPGCGCLLLGDHAPHGVKADGTVHASVVCNNCSFHQHVKLLGWNNGVVEHS